MRAVSKTNKSFDSDGNSYSQAQVNARITQAKADKLEQMREEHGYIFCEECGLNASSGQALDCSHDVSVKEAKETRRVELAWDVENIKIRCRKCHQRKDGLYLGA